MEARTRLSPGLSHKDRARGRRGRGEPAGAPVEAARSAGANVRSISLSFGMEGKMRRSLSYLFAVVRLSGCGDGASPGGGDGSSAGDDGASLMCGEGTWQQMNDDSARCVAWTLCGAGGRAAQPHTASLRDSCSGCLCSASSGRAGGARLRGCGSSSGQERGGGVTGAGSCLL